MSRPSTAGVGPAVRRRACVTRWPVGLVTGMFGLCAACPGPSRGRDAKQQLESPDPFEVSESIYDRALKNGWLESGTVERDKDEAGPAKVRFNISGEWILSHPGLTGRFGAVVFRVKEPAGEGEFLEVGLASQDRRQARAVKLKPEHCTLLDEGWMQVILPMSELNPDGASFDRIIFRPFRPFGSDWILFDKVALAKASPGLASALESGPLRGKSVRARVACDQAASKISPYVYGIAFGDTGWEKLGATARRWGGNRKTRYNWEGNFENAGLDWFFENSSSPPYTEFLSESAAHGAVTALTIPTIGWVSKDGASFSYPVSVFGPQAKTDPWKADAGNGMSVRNAPIAPGPPTRTSVPAPPDWAGQWVAAIRASDTKAGKRSVYEYILDNEPALWNANHRDVHPEPVGYDELLDRTIEYGTAIRRADPDAVIAGPAEWGWSGYLYSAKDLATGHADRRAHGNVALVEWYLRKLQEHERRTGTRVLDVLDVHYYPQEDNVYGGGAGGTDRTTQLLRLRSTRSLWDPTYVDESWIKESIHLLPRMREWIDANYPGRGISIGEWNFGGENDVTGALATAEALGRFAQFGVTSAFYWMAPRAESASRFGFLAYRNFDRRGGHFLDWYVPTTPAEGVSFFASRDETRKHLVIVAINMLPDAAMVADLDLTSCGTVASLRSYTYDRGSTGFQPHADADGGDDTERPLPPWSITVFDVLLSSAPSTR